ncbi:hypothetical protein D3C85_1874160 [compost metagenome]
MFELAKITSVSPFRIQINGMKIELDADDLIVTESVKGRDLNIGDTVLVVSMGKGQTYAVIDRAYVS